MFCFVRKSLQQQLPTLANLLRWGKALSASCPLCNQLQTNKHVLSNCSSISALHRYKLRHDAILLIICNWIKSVSAVSIYADIPGFEPLSVLFQSLRPDIAIVKAKVIYICELTVCHESNMIKSREYKLSKYNNINHNLRNIYKDHSIVTTSLEVSVLGFISDCSMFMNSVVNQVIPNCISDNIIRNVIYNSYGIYLNRNKID